MFKRTILHLFIVASLMSTVPAHAAKPTSVAGKIGAGLLQLIHHHPYLLTFPFVPPYLHHKFKTNLPSETALAMSFIGWLIAGKLTQTTSKIIMDACDIEPVKE